MSLNNLPELLLEFLRDKIVERYKNKINSDKYII